MTWVEGQPLSEKYRVECVLRSGGLFAGTAIAVLTLLAPGRALAAPTRNECVDANTQAQDLRRDNHLLKARAALLLCAQESCPGIVRKDCIQRLDEFEAIVPSIAFEVKDASGQDLSDVTVTMDNQPFLNHLDGTPIELDPGDHSFAFSAAGMKPKTLKLVVRQGDRGRREAVTLASTTEAAPPMKRALEPEGPPSNVEPTAAPTRKVLAWTAVAVGGAGLVLGGVTAGLAISKKKTIDHADDCQQNHCDPRESSLVNQYNQFRTVSSIGFIAGGVIAATGVVLLLTAPHSPEPRAALWVGVGSLGLVGKFQ